MGGGKGGGGNTWGGSQQSTVSIPPEVMARYNSVNARAEDVAQNPFQFYQGQFVAPVNQYQQEAMNQLWNTTKNYQPWFDYAAGSLEAGHNAAIPYYQQATNTLNQGLGAANNIAYGALGTMGSGLNTIAGGLGAASPFNTAASQGFSNAYDSAQPLNAAAINTMGGAYSSAQPFNSAAISQMIAGLQGASPYNNMAGGSFGSAYANAQPYQSGATNLALAGTGAVNPGDLDIARYFSPYNDAVVKSTLGLLDQQQAQQQNALKSNAIMAGAYGGDRSDIASAVLSGQQGLARSQVASDLYNQMYGQALGVAQQQQGLDYTAGAANRAALQSGASTLAGIGNQGFMQGYNTAQGYAGLGNQLYNQGLGAASLYGNIGNQAFSQGATAAGLYGNIGNQMYNQGLGAAQGQLAVGNQIFGQNLAAGQGIAGVGQSMAGVGNQIFNQGLGAAGAQQSLGQGLYQQGLANSNQYANIGSQLNNLGLASNQALLGAGTVGQQTDQANMQAQYNQFLQSQAYPFQVAQFLANIAMGTGSLSGSTTSTNQYQPQPFFSDERLKEDIREIGKTKDGIPIISFKYKGSPHTQIGMRAQDVEDVRPEAVGLAGGYKTVDYDAATKRDARASGGLVPYANDNREHFAGGGMGVADPLAMAQILAAHQAMYPGAAGRPGIDQGPRGIQLAQLPTGKLNPVQHSTMKAPEPQAKTLLDSAGKLKDFYGLGKEAYTEGKDALVGSAPVMDKNGNVTKGGTEGWIGRDGDWSSSKGWFEGLGRAANANAPSGTITRSELSPVPDTSATSASTTEGLGGVSTALSGAPVSETLVAAAEDIPVEDIVEQSLAYAQRGGRMYRKVGGGAPYADVESYVPEEKPKDYSDNFKKMQDQADDTLPEEKKGGAGGGAGKGAMGAAGTLLGLGIGSMFGMPMLGGMIGGAGGGLAGSLFNRGGRAGYDEGGGVDPDEIEKLKGLGANVIPFDLSARALPDRAPAPDTTLRHTSMMPRDQLPSMPEYEWKARVRPPDNSPGLPLSERLPVPSIAPRQGLNPPPTEAPAADPVTVQATPPVARGSATVADALAPKAEGLGAAQPPAVTPEAARAAVNQTAATIPTPPSPGLNPPTQIQTPPGFRSPGGVDSPEDYLVRMRTQESGGNQWNPKTGTPLTSSAGAVGVMQVMPGTGPEAAKLAGLPWNPELFNRARTGNPDQDRETTEYNAALGRAYYMQQVKDFGDPAIAAAAYNAGPGAVRQAQARAAASGGNYLDYLPKETRDYVAIVSGKGRPGSAVALNVQNQPQDATGLNPAQTPAQAPDGGLKPPRDFLDRAGDWIDRNERPIMAGLSFLGNMLSSPSRTLLGSIGSGLAAAAPQYMAAGFREKELGQGQQRIDIVRSQKLIDLGNQLRPILASQFSKSGRYDPETLAQYNRLAEAVRESMGGKGGLPPIQQPDMAQPGPGAPPPVSLAPGPQPAGTPPAGSPAAPGGPPAATPAGLPPSMQPPPRIEQSFYDKLGELSPARLRQKAQDMQGTNPDEANRLWNQAAAIDAQINGTGQALDPQGNVVMSEAWPNVEAAKRRTIENVEWARNQETAFQARKIMAENVRKIADVVKEFEPGQLNTLLSDVQATAKGLGIPVRNTPTMNAEAYQKFIKEAATVLTAAPTGDQRTDAARAQLAAAFATPNLQPGAVRSILAQTLGKFELLDDYYRDVTEKLPQARYMDIPRRQAEFDRERPLDAYTAKYLRDTPVLGDLPKTKDDLKEGYVYMFTPKDIVKFWGSNDKGERVLDVKDVRKQMGGDKPKPFRVQKDGTILEIK